MSFGETIVGLNGRYYLDEMEHDFCLQGGSCDPLLHEIRVRVFRVSMKFSTIHIQEEGFHVHISDIVPASTICYIRITFFVPLSAER